ncbi:hemerythrin domain-containing protein [Azohydromonas caseinilytica]|uniref:Hemerythrin domain-containing protein n=1 Tax=Azohydromonas caseinilytica TaxID=2728836 RepID=A0A848F4N1_9BURK|nr:hemerythrin domain-containing protein [Azohydromonas caseinilytica]NML13566.1 hemerythrin domain-containing protein [Azohydromonas caseinilytica]
MNQFLNKLSPSITNMIRMDHTHVLATFHQYEVDTPPKTKQALAKTVCLALEIHAQLEEEIFYPALREAQSDNAVLDKSVPEHDEMRTLIARLRTLDPTDPEHDRVFMSLMRAVMHHVADEETTLLPQAELGLADRLNELGAKMTKRRLELTAPHAGEIAANTVRTMPASSMALAAGALLMGGYMLKQTFRHRRHMG